MRHIILLALSCFCASAMAAEYTVLRPQQSAITFVSKQMGVPVEGVFKKFSAEIAVNPARPESGTARIRIDLNSIDAGNADANAELGGKNWFDTRHYPAASFVASRVTRLDANRYEASGSMTIKGKTLSVKAPFTLRPAPGALAIDGTFTLKRLDYGIGTGIWADTSVVADEVTLNFHFTVTEAKR